MDISNARPHFTRLTPFCPPSTLGWGFTISLYGTDEETEALRGPEQVARLVQIPNTLCGNLKFEPRTAGLTPHSARQHGPAHMNPFRRELVITVPVFPVLQLPEWLGWGPPFSTVWAWEGQLKRTWSGASSLKAVPSWGAAGTPG